MAINENSAFCQDWFITKPSREDYQQMNSASYFPFSISSLYLIYIFPLPTSPYSTIPSSLSFVSLKPVHILGPNETLIFLRNPKSHSDSK